MQITVYMFLAWFGCVTYFVSAPLKKCCNVYEKLKFIIVFYLSEYFSAFVLVSYAIDIFLLISFTLIFVSMVCQLVINTV